MKRAKEGRRGDGVPALRHPQAVAPSPQYVHACGPADRGRRRQRHYCCERIVRPSRMHGVIPRFGRAAYGGTTRTSRKGAGASVPGLVAGLMDTIEAAESL